MNERRIREALGCKRPMNALYELIPEDRKGDFEKLVNSFGFTEEKIRVLLGQE